MTTFALLTQRCGLSISEAAEFLDVPLNTIKSWSSGRRATPQGVIDELRALYRLIEDSAAKALIEIGDLLAEAGEPPAEFEIGVAETDGDAKSLGLPCAAAHRTMAGLVAARLSLPVRIVPRGSTLATKAAKRARISG